MARVYCRTCGNDVGQGVELCLHCNASRVANEKKQSALRRWGVMVAAGVAVFVALSALGGMVMDGAQRPYRVKGRLASVSGALAPIEAAIAAAYQKTGSAPAISTVLTAANQGRAATPDWAALGFATLPELPAYIKILHIGAEGDIVVSLTRVDPAIDDTELHAHPTRATEGVSWQFECTSTDGTLKRFFAC